MGQVSDASMIRVRGSRAFVRDTSADKLSARAIPCVFLGFPPDAPGWQFYHPTLRHVFPSQDNTFDKSVPFYRVSQVDPLPCIVPVEIALASGAARGVAYGGAESEGAGFGGAEPGGAERGGVEPAGVEPGGATSVGAESEGAGSGGTEPGGAEPGDAELAGVELGVAESEDTGSRGAEPRGTASSGGPVGASP
ncbi:unnamed protein product [Closterium sp. NIES-53]